MRQDTPRAADGVLAAKVYQQLRDEFRSDASPEEVLERVNTTEDDAINPQLLKVAITYQQSKHRSAFNGALRALEMVGLRGLAGTGQCGLSIRPPGCAEQVRYFIDLTSFFVRLKVASICPEQAALMAQVWDEVLCEAQIKSSPKQAVPFVSFERCGDRAWLVLPSVATNRLLASSTWLEVQADRDLAETHRRGVRPAHGEWRLV